MAVSPTLLCHSAGVRSGGTLGTSLLASLFSFLYTGNSRMESKGHFKKGTIKKKSHGEVPWLEAIPVAVSRKSVAEWLHHLCASILSPSFLTSHRSSKLYIL